MSFSITSMWGHWCLNGQQLALFCSGQSGFRNVSSGLSTLLSFSCYYWENSRTFTSLRLHSSKWWTGRKRIVFVSARGGVITVTKTWRWHWRFRAYLHERIQILYGLKTLDIIEGESESYLSRKFLQVNQFSFRSLSVKPGRCFTTTHRKHPGHFKALDQLQIFWM